MGRRRHVNHKPIRLLKEVPLETIQRIEEPLERLDAIIKQMEELLNEVKYVRLLAKRRRDRDKALVIENRLNS